MKYYHSPKTLLAVIVLSFFILSCNDQPTKPSNGRTVAELKKNNTMNEDSLMNFAQDYTKAWSSQNPERVADHFAEDGSLTVNNGAPATGRIAIAKVAQSFMTDFPDLALAMDSLPATEKGIEYHWTLRGTNTGPNGTGKKVRISGVEIWQLDSNGLIKESTGSFDQNEYNRQLKEGINN